MTFQSPIMTHATQHSSLFGVQGAPQSPYGFPGMPQGGLGGSLMQMMMPMLSQQFSAATGMFPGQWSPTQGMADQFRAREFQQVQMQASQEGSKMDAQSMERTWRGIQLMRGVDYDGDTELQAHGKKIGNAWAAMAPYIGMVAPGLADSLAGGVGSGAAFATQAAMANQYRTDALTGRMGFSGAASGEMSTQIQEMLYGSGNASEMAGFGMGRAGELYRVGASRGMVGGGGLRSIIGREAIERLREDGGGDVRGALGDKAGLLSGEQLDKLQSASADGGGVDSAIRGFDSKKTAAWLKSMAGAVNAMEDIVGIGAPMEQLINSLNALTQNGLSTQSPEQLEQTVRKMAALSKSSGISIQNGMRLTAYAAKVAMAGGGSAQDGVIASMHAQSFAAGFKNDGARAGLLAGAGVDIDRLAQQDAQLTAQAGNSATGTQLAATMRIMDELGFAEDSEGAAMAKAIAEGKTTYSFGGKHNISVSKDETEWRDIVARDSSLTRSQATSVRNQRHSNAYSGREHRTAGVARKLQYEQDIDPTIRNIYSTAAQTGATALSPAKAAEVAEKISGIIQNYVPTDGLTDREQRDELRAKTVVALVEAGMSRTDAETAAFDAYGQANTYATGANAGYESLTNISLQHGRGHLAHGAAADTRAGNTGDLTQAMRSMGRAGPLKRLIDAIQKGDADAVKLAGALLGGVEVSATLKTALEEYKDLSGKIDPKTGRLSAKDEKKRLALLKTIRAEAEAVGSDIKKGDLESDKALDAAMEGADEEEKRKLMLAELGISEDDGTVDPAAAARGIRRLSGRDAKAQDKLLESMNEEDINKMLASAKEIGGATYKNMLLAAKRKGHDVSEELDAVTAAETAAGETTGPGASARDDSAPPGGPLKLSGSLTLVFPDGKEGTGTFTPDSEGVPT
jgi:hypothetical protein